jgi:hypothetical protein
MLSALEASEQGDADAQRVLETIATEKKADGDAILSEWMSVTKGARPSGSAGGSSSAANLSGSSTAGKVPVQATGPTDTAISKGALGAGSYADDLRGKLKGDLDGGDDSAINTGLGNMRFSNYTGYTGLGRHSISGGGRDEAARIAALSEAIRQSMVDSARVGTGGEDVGKENMNLDFDYYYYVARL